MVATEGSKLLASWLTKAGHNRSWLASKLGVAGSTVTRWLDCSWRPSQQHILVIEALTGIESSRWLTPEERKQIRRVLPEAS